MSLLIASTEHAEPDPRRHDSDHECELRDRWKTEAPVVGLSGECDQHYQYDEEGIASTKRPAVIAHTESIGSAGAPLATSADMRIRESQFAALAASTTAAGASAAEAVRGKFGSMR